MGARLAMCVEEAACLNPGIIGLEGEDLDAQPWLAVYTSGGEAREGIAQSGEVEEAWVLSCEDVEPINLAASIKHDNPELRVCLVTAASCGSLLSRAHTADIDEVLEYRGFLHRYVQVKQSMRRQGGDIGAVPVASSGDGGEGRREAPRRWERPSSGGAPSGQRGRGEELFEVGNDRGASATAVVPSSAEESSQIDLVLCEPHPSQPLVRLAQSQPLAGPLTLVDNRAFVLTVVSGSGGAGKSAVSSIGALAANKMGFKTLLLDCDLQFGDIAEMVGARSPLPIDEAILHPERMEADAMQTETLAVLSAPARLEASEEVVRQLPALLERASASFDVVVVNTGASWAEQHALLLERSSASLFLVDQRVSSVRACKHALELCARCGIASSPFQYALNRCAKGAPLTTMDVSSALQGVPVLELKDGGRDVEDYLSGGAARDLIEVRNEFAKSVERVIERMLPGESRLMGERPEAAGEKRSFRRRSRHAGGKRGKRQL